MDKRRLCLALLVLMLPVSAQADRHKIGFRGAVVHAGRSDLWGLQVSFDFPFSGESSECAKCPPEEGFPKVKLGTWSAVTEVSLVTGIHREETGEETLSQFTYLAGLRYSLNRIGCNRRFQFFGQALLGRAEEKLGTGPSSLSLAGAFGGGVDIPIGSVRSGDHPSSAIRVQADAYWMRSHPTLWYPQISIGYVLRYSSHRPKPMTP